MKTYLTSFLAVCLFALAACSPSVSTNKTANVDLGKYSTFAFLPNADIRMPAAMEEKLSSDDVNGAIVSSLNESMRSKGYTLDRSNPDLLILLSTSTEKRTDVDKDPIYANTTPYATYPYTGTYAGYNTISPYYNDYYYNGYLGYNNVIGYDTDVTRYKEGTLVVDIVDRKTKKMIWKGVSSTSIYDGTSTDAIQSMVNAILAEYPMQNEMASR